MAKNEDWMVNNNWCGFIIFNIAENDPYGKKSLKEFCFYKSMKAIDVYVAYHRTTQYLKSSKAKSNVFELLCLKMYTFNRALIKEC